LIGCRQCSIGRHRDQWTNDKQPATPCACRQTLHLLQVLIEPLQLLVRGAKRLRLQSDPRLDDDSLEVFKGRAHDMPRTLDRAGASAARQMLADEVLDVMIQGDEFEAPSRRPVREVRQAVDIRPHRAVGISHTDQAIAVRLNERDQDAGSKALRRERRQSVEDIHADLLKWCCHVRRSDFLCEVQVLITHRKRRQVVHNVGNAPPQFA